MVLSLSLARYFRTWIRKRREKDRLQNQTGWNKTHDKFPRETLKKHIGPHTARTHKPKQIFIKQLRDY